MVKKLFIETRLYNYYYINIYYHYINIDYINIMTYVFKGHVKIVKIYMLKMVKFNVSVLNSLKMFFCKYKVNT